MKSDFDKGLKLGIQFAVENFLGCLPFTVANELENKTTEYLLKLWKDREKEYDKGNF